MTTEQLRPLLSTLAEHPELRGYDVRVFILAERVLDWREPREMKLESVAPRQRNGRRSRGAAANALKRLVSAGFVIVVDRKGSRGRRRYRLPQPPHQLIESVSPMGNQK